MDQHEKPVEARQDHRRKGQALAEFAITLPILLLLLFGIIEFGRLFQAWVTLQNAARTAARYASTGQYFEDRYDINEIVPCDVVRDAITLEIKGGNNPDSGTLSQIPVDYSGQAMQVQFYQADNDPNTLQEDLFATWYNGKNCIGSDPEDQQLQRDILRIVSIYEEARRGAAGLAIEDTRIPTRDADGVKAFLYEVWQRPQPGRDRPGWFNVMICSDRGPMVEGSRLVYGPNATDELSVGTRFLTLLEPADAYTMRLNYDNEPGREFEIPPEWAPTCVLREKPPQNAGWTYNVGIPWIDPGGPGDTVTIVVSFNHPLITPLGFAPFIPLQARRTAVNEAFRTSDVPLFNPPGEGIGSVPELGSPTPTDVPATNTPLPPTETPLPATNTPLPPTTAPFDCNKIKAQNVTFFANRYYIEFTNDNIGNSWLVKSIIIWENQAMKTDYPDVGIGLKALEGEIYFIGAPDKVSPTDSSNPADGSYQSGAFLEVPGQSTTVRWEGVFVQGPPLIADYMQPWDFTGTTFFFDNPDTSGINADCAVTLILPPTPPPTSTPDPNVTPTATYTPDCASTSMRVEFVSFDPLGDVRLRVVNNRSVVAPMTDFNIAWREPSGRDIFLVKVVAGGNNANDLPQFGGNGTVVWQGNPQDDNPATRGRQEGTWVTNYTFPPNSSTFLHLDFSGIGNLTLAQVGISASDFNGTWFDIGCGSSGGGTGGTGGGGSGGQGTIFLSEVPSPVPTNTPRPTNTPGPTLTPSNTFTPAPPTKTWTPAPPTFTFTPQPATATPTQTPFVVPTVPGIGGGDAGS